MENKEFFDRIPKYSDFVMEKQGEIYENTKKLLDEQLKDAKRVLDVGNGGVINYNYSHLDKLDCLDVSINEKTVAKYKDFTNIEFILGDAKNTRLPEKSYDFVFMQYLLHHLVGKDLDSTKRNVKKCIVEALRVLNDSGKILIVEPMMPNWMFKLEEYLFSPIQFFCKIIKHGQAFQYSLSEIRDIVKTIPNANFKVVKRIDPGKYIIVFKTRFPAKAIPLGVYMLEISRK